MAKKSTPINTYRLNIKGIDSEVWFRVYEFHAGNKVEAMELVREYRETLKATPYWSQPWAVELIAKIKP